MTRIAPAARRSSCGRSLRIQNGLDSFQKWAEFVNSSHGQCVTQETFRYSEEEISVGKNRFLKKEQFLGNQFSVHRNAKPFFRRIDYTRFRDRLFSDSETGFLTAKPVSLSRNRFRYERTGFPLQKPGLPRENRFPTAKTGFAARKPVFGTKNRFCPGKTGFQG